MAPEFLQGWRGDGYRPQSGWKEVLRRLSWGCICTESVLFFYTFFWNDFERSGGHYKSQCQSYSKFSPSPACLLLCFSPSVPPTPTHLVHQTPGLPCLALLCQTLRGAVHWHEWTVLLMLLSAQPVQLYKAVLSRRHSQFPPLTLGHPQACPWSHTRFHSRSSSQILMGRQPPKSSSAAQMWKYTPRQVVRLLWSSTQMQIWRSSLSRYHTCGAGIVGLGFFKLEELLGGLLVHHPPQVKTEAPIQPEEQASASMTARPYSTQDESGNFLHIDVKALSTEVGNNIQLSLNAKLQDSSVNNKITRFTILVRGWDQDLHRGILSLGQLWQAELVGTMWDGRRPRGGLKQRDYGPPLWAGIALGKGWSCPSHP